MEGRSGYVFTLPSPWRIPVRYNIASDGIGTSCRVRRHYLRDLDEVEASPSNDMTSLTHPSRRPTGFTPRAPVRGPRREKARLCDALFRKIRNERQRESPCGRTCVPKYALYVLRERLAGGANYNLRSPDRRWDILNRAGLPKSDDSETPDLADELPAVPRYMPLISSTMADAPTIQDLFISFANVQNLIRASMLCTLGFVNHGYACCHLATFRGRT